MANGEAFFVKPVADACPLTGWWGSYPGHKGLDYGWRDANTPEEVKAAFDGVVVSVYGGGGDNGGWGNRIIIEHAPGIRTTYNHLATGTIRVSQGQRVSTDQVLAIMGSTGRVTGRHLHWELYIDGVRVDPRPYREGKAIPRVMINALLGYQRKVTDGVEARRRAQPTTQSESKEGPLAGGTIGDFDAWTHGENVSGNDIWIRGLYSGDWFWSGSFTDTGTHDLIEVNNQPLNPKQRIVGSATMSRRTGPGTQYTKKDPALAPGEVGNFENWTEGEQVTIGGISSNIWIQGISGDWFAIAGFTSQSTDGLTHVTFSTSPPEVPSEVLDTSFKNFTNDSQLAKWIGSPNYNYREPRPADQHPRHITMHWMAGTLAGTDAQFQKYSKLVNGRGDGSAANYGVGQTEIHQYVRERDYQQADGNTESNRWGISIEHEMGPNIPITPAVINRSAALLVDIAKRYGWTKLELNVNVFPHKHWVATDCPGTLPIQEILDVANAALSPVIPKPNPGEETIPVPKSWLESLYEGLKKLLRK